MLILLNKLFQDDDFQNMNNNITLLETKNQVEFNNQKEVNKESENSFIEGLRIELEVALGLSLFKMAYNIIQDNVKIYLNYKKIIP